MKKDFLKIGDTQFRVEINWATVEEFENLSGKTLGQFEAEITENPNNITARDIRTWMYCAIREGQDMEGKPFERTQKEFTRMLSPNDAKAFVPIFIKQFSGNVKAAAESAKPEEPQKKRMFHRLRSVRTTSAK